MVVDLLDDLRTRVETLRREASAAADGFSAEDPRQPLARSAVETLDWVVVKIEVARSQFARIAACVPAPPPTPQVTVERAQEIARTVYARAQKTCGICGQPGHYATTCAKRQAARVITPNEVIADDPDDDEEEPMHARRIASRSDARAIAARAVKWEENMRDPNGCDRIYERHDHVGPVSSGACGVPKCDFKVQRCETDGGAVAVQQMLDAHRAGMHRAKPKAPIQPGAPRRDSWWRSTISLRCEKDGCNTTVDGLDARQHLEDAHGIDGAKAITVRMTWPFEYLGEASRGRSAF